MTAPYELNVLEAISDEIAELLTLYTYQDVLDSASLSDSLSIYLDTYPIEAACT